MSKEDKSKGGVSVYLCDTKESGISLEVSYTDATGYSYGIGLASPGMRGTCYTIIGQNCLACVKQEEEKNAMDNLVYTETITVWQLAPGEVKEACRISRKIESRVNDLKAYQITSDSDYVIYAEGYDSYTAEGATFMSTEQEFDDQVNGILQKNSLNCIRLNEMSWDSRWNGVYIDKDSIQNAIAKVEFSSANSYIDENGDEVTDITITVNGEDSEKTE